MSLVVTIVIAAFTAIAASGWLLVAQGRYARARAPRLPEAPGPAVGDVDGASPPLRLLLIGDSTVAGVCAASHTDGLAGSTGRSLASRTGRAVRWSAIGRSGFALPDIQRELLPRVQRHSADVVILVSGVNDATRLHTSRQWRRDLRTLIRRLRELLGPVPVFLAGVPPMGKFPALPQPLRAFIGFRAHRLDRAARRVARETTGVFHVPTTIEHAGDFCVDGYHPGPGGYARWGTALGLVVADTVSER